MADEFSASSPTKDHPRRVSLSSSASTVVSSSSLTPEREKSRHRESGFPVDLEKSDAEIDWWKKSSNLEKRPFSSGDDEMGQDGGWRGRTRVRMMGVFGQRRGRFTGGSHSRGLSSYLSKMRLSPRWRRYIFSWLLVAAILWTVWHMWVRDRFWEHRAIVNSIYGRPEDGFFGTNVSPHFDGFARVKDFNRGLLPAKKGHRDRERRLIVIGDVHGCKASLTALLDKLKFDQKFDHVIFAGDMIQRGPDSKGVLEMARKMKASCVRGNHEDRILLAYHEMDTKWVNVPGPGERAGSEYLDTMDEESFSHGDYKDRRLAHKLSKDDVEYLKSCPLILNLGAVPGMSNVAVAHAGLVPGVSLDNQDPFAVMNMRSIDLKTHVPSSEKNGVVWTKLWNPYQKSLPKDKRLTVVYGHYAKRGLEIHPYSKGLDSNCVRGGKLSALVLRADGPNSTKQKVVSVQCKDKMKGNEN